MWRHQNICSAFSWFFSSYFGTEHDEKPPHTKFGVNWFMVAQDMAAWIQISPIEISVNWPGSYNCLEPGQFTLISMGLILYSCGHILGPHEPIPTKFVVWRFFIMLYRNMKKKKSWKCWKNIFDDVITLVLYSNCTRESSTKKTCLKIQQNNISL